MVVLFPTAAEGATQANGIIFAHDGGGIKIYSEQTSRVLPLKTGRMSIDGVAYDANKNKVYYSTSSAIYGINLDGSGDEIQYSSQCEYANLTTTTLGL